MKEENRREQVTITLPRKVRKEVKEIVEDRDISLSRLITDLLRREIEENAERGEKE